MALDIFPIMLSNKLQVPSTLELLTNTLSWTEHIIKITNKANSIRTFLQKNLS